MTEPVISPLLPPDHPPREPAHHPPLPLLPPAQPTVVPDGNGLLIATARIDHSGRVGDRGLLAALGWLPGDHHDVRVVPHGATLTRSPCARFPIDARHNVFLPAATRHLLAVRPGDRLVLVALPAADRLIVHPTAVVAELLAEFYRRLEDAPDGR